MATLDEADHVNIVDRIKELIKYKGFQVTPAEVEAVLVAHPAVADAAVIGVPDEEAGEVPKAFVVVAPGAEAPTLAELQDFTAGHQVGYKQVRRLEVVDAIPRAPRQNPAP